MGAEPQQIDRHLRNVLARTLAIAPTPTAAGSGARRTRFPADSCGLDAGRPHPTAPRPRDPRTARAWSRNQNSSLAQFLQSLCSLLDDTHGMPFSSRGRRGSNRQQSPQHGQPGGRTIPPRKPTRPRRADFRPPRSAATKRCPAQAAPSPAAATGRRRSRPHAGRRKARPARAPSETNSIATIRTSGSGPRLGRHPRRIHDPELGNAPTDSMSPDIVADSRRLTKASYFLLLIS